MLSPAGFNISDEQHEAVRVISENAVGVMDVEDDFVSSIRDLAWHFLQAVDLYQ